MYRAQPNENRRTIIHSTETETTTNYLCTAVGHIRREFVKLPYSSKAGTERSKVRAYNTGVAYCDRSDWPVIMRPLPIVIFLLRIIPVSGKFPAR
jgi:hypothetical protein